MFYNPGETNLSPELAMLCGRELPGSIHSTGDSMFLRFTSDAIINGRGFNASYSKGKIQNHYRALFIDSVYTGMNDTCVVC